MTRDEAIRRAAKVAERVRDCDDPADFHNLLANALLSAAGDERLAVVAGDGLRAAIAVEQYLEARENTKSFLIGLDRNLAKLGRRVASLAKLAEQGDVRAVATRTVGELLPAVNQHIEATGRAARRLEATLAEAACIGVGGKGGKVG